MAEAWPYRFAVLPRSELFVDERYQRPLTNFAQQIADNFDPAMFGTVIVNERANRSKAPYAVIDGQQRLHGAGENGLEEIPSLVYENMPLTAEARLFARLQTERRGIVSWIRFRSQLVAKDPEATAIAALVRSAGFKMAGDEDDLGIRSIAAVEQIYRKDPELLVRVLNVVSTAWPTNGPVRADPRTRNEILRGISRFLTDEDNVDDTRLAKRMKTLTPDQLRHRANALREGSGSSGNFELFIRDALVGVYATRSRIDP